MQVGPEDVRGKTDIVERLRKFCGVPPAVQREAADQIELLRQRLADEGFLQRAFYQILQDNGILPTSAELIDANERALKALERKDDD